MLLDNHHYGLRTQFPETRAGAPIREGRAAEKAQHAQRKFLKTIKDKSSDQIFKMMDSIEGIRKLKRVLSLTPGGEQLFNELARFKLSRDDR